jgi:hypothetical protein
VHFPIIAAKIKSGKGNFLRTIHTTTMSGMAESIANIVAKNKIILLSLVDK